MNREIKYNKICIEIEHKDLQNMALTMQKELKNNEYLIPLEICLNTVSKQVGFQSYKEFSEKFKQLEYEINKVHLIHTWVEKFLTIGFKGWEIEPVEIEDYGDMLRFNIFGKNQGVNENREAIYESMWLVLSELIYLENDRSSRIYFQGKTKKEIERKILEEIAPTDVTMIKLLEKIRVHIKSLSEVNKVGLINNCVLYYLTPEKENKNLYQNK